MAQGDCSVMNRKEKNETTVSVSYRGKRRNQKEPDSALRRLRGGAKRAAVASESDTSDSDFVEDTAHLAMVPDKTAGRYNYWKEDLPVELCQKRGLVCYSRASDYFKPTKDVRKRLIGIGGGRPECLEAEGKKLQNAVLSGLC